MTTTENTTYAFILTVTMEDGSEDYDFVHVKHVSREAAKEAQSKAYTARMAKAKEGKPMFSSYLNWASFELA